MKIWAREMKSGHAVREMTVEDVSEETRTHKVFHALEQVCLEFNLAQPIWLESTVREFQRHAKCRFYQDAWVEEISFDYLELQVLEED